MPLDSSLDFDVEQFQRWMFELVTHPEGVDGGSKAAHRSHGVSVERMVLPSRLRSASERIGVYAGMYFNRLVEILFNDFPALAHALGDQGFYHLGRDYLVKHPSRSKQLVTLGQHLEEFIANEADVDDKLRPFLVELARLEMVLELLFHAKRSPRLDPAELRAIPPEEWVGARLRPVHAFDLLAFEYPINAYFRGVIQEEEPAIPEPQRSWIAVWRKDYSLWRSAISEEQYTILRALQNGTTLGEALMACTELPEFNPETVMASVGKWFEDWTADGLFAEVLLPA